VSEKLKILLVDLKKKIGIEIIFKNFPKKHFSKQNENKWNNPVYK
jgi:hypothetical protein